MKIYKKLVLMFSISLAVFSGIVLTTEAIYQPTEVTTTPKSNVSTTQTRYIVAEYQGKIAVFNEDNTTPIHVFESPYVRDLPKYDRELLTKGIVVESNTELLKILEDYDN